MAQSSPKEQPVAAGAELNRLSWMLARVEREIGQLEKERTALRRMIEAQVAPVGQPVASPEFLFFMRAASTRTGWPTTIMQTTIVALRKAGDEERATWLDSLKVETPISGGLVIKPRTDE